MALRQHNLPGSQVWGDLVTSAADPQDVQAATKRIKSGLLAAAQAFGSRELELADPQCTPVQLDDHAKAALRRLQKRAMVTGTDLPGLLLTGNISAWEQLITDSFQQGLGLNLEPAYVQQQLVNEFKLLLQLGRRLVMPDTGAGVSTDVTTQLQFRGADGQVAMRTVSLMFPANSRTVVRLMEAWWACQGCDRPAKGKRASSKAAGKAEHRGMATRFFSNVLVLLFWQAQLMTSLVAVNDQMNVLKAAGHPLWYNPSSLTNGGRFANNTPALLARQAAMGMLAATWHIYTGGRPAECFRMRWQDSSVPGLDGEPPVWALGLAGLLKEVQDTPGAGFCMMCYHCKNGYNYGAPDPVDILPACCSGLCLAAVINLAFMVLTYLCPTSPDTPIVQQQSEAEQKPQLTLNNPCGYVFAYGGLQFVPVPDATQPVAKRDQVGDGLGDTVGDAINSAGFLKRCWAKIKDEFGAADVPAPPPGHNAAGFYSFRTTMAGEVSLLKRQLAASILPADLWDWYLVRAGRSDISNSYATYVSNYVKAFGDRLTYVRDVGTTWLTVVFKKAMLDWLPTKFNTAAVKQLSAAQAAALKTAKQLSDTYRLNKTTPDIHNRLVSLVQQKGSLAGMLQTVGVPFCHSGYQLATPAEGMDLQHMRLSAAKAVQTMQVLVGRVHAGAVALGWQLPAAPARPVLLQCTPDLLCADWETLQRSLEAPTVSPQAATGTQALSAQAVQQGPEQRDPEQDWLEPTFSPTQQVHSTDLEAPAAAPARAPVGPGVTAAQQQPQQPQQPQHSQAAPVASGTPQQVGSSPGNPEQGQPGSSLLRRGGGMLLLLPNRWGGKAKSMQGSALIADVRYTHYSITQLMTREGLLLSGGPQEVSVRVAADFCGDAVVVGAWSKQPYTVSVDPQHALLLHCQPPQPVGRRFLATSVACTHTHEALFGWTPADITAAIGKLELQQTLTQQRERRASAAPGWMRDYAEVPVQQSAAVAAEPVEATPGPSARVASAGPGTASVVSSSVQPVEGQLRVAQDAVMDLLLAADAAQLSAAYTQATTAVKPLLLHGLHTPQAVSAVTGCLKQLFGALSRGEPAPDGLLQSIEAGMQQLAAGSKGAAMAASAGAKRSLQVALDDADEQMDPKKPCLDQQPCLGCGEVDGEQMVCDWCCEATMHPVCCGLQGVPEGAWLCPGCSSDPQRLQVVQQCYLLEGSWVRARFGSKWLWGRVEYCSHGDCAVQYEDGTSLSPYSVAQLRGTEPCEGHSYLKLVPQSSVPQLVVAKFAAEGWLEA